MRIAFIASFCGITLLTLSIAACEDDSTTPSPGGPSGIGLDGGGNTTDGGPASDGAPAIEGGGAGCPGATSTPDPAVVDTLFKMLGGWHRVTSVENGNDVDIPDCDKTLGFTIGPIGSSTPAAEYAACAVARGGLVPIKGGSFPTANPDCTQVSCSPEAGLRMMTDKAAAVFLIGPDGKSQGSPIFYFQIFAKSLDPVGPELFNSNTANDFQNGVRLARSSGQANCQL